ncbi:MAG: argininosuccinate lyase [Deltaproteobacteria bacterium]|nr:MAG: argininosuccinate lyase [Deltaproteobacteria bacterium]
MAKSGKTSRTWGGRFKRRTADDALAFTASIGFDIRLYPYDVRVSIAHARMLAACGIISQADCKKIVAGLESVRQELDAGRFRPQLADEDIHMAIERRLVEKIGDVGAKLHAARSRNDQVATDVRMFVKDAIDEIDGAIGNLQGALVDIAARDGEAVLPGYTHLQRAQPILLGHHLLAYYDMLERDRGRLADCRRRTDVLPLGAGALAGTTLPIDRRQLAKELGFARIAENSIDAIADRDFIAELLAALSIVFAHISRLASDVTLWATSEFGFVVLDDAYSTGSSMMPQKKNPDIAELVRGKSGRVFGDLMALLTVLKGLPLAYNSDLQEDKEALFDAVDTSTASLEALAALMRSLEFDRRRMAAAAADGFLLATDIAEYLVARGIPFRRAHEITGRIVRWCLDHDTDPTKLSAEELGRFSDAFEDDIARLLTPQRAIARRKAIGGTSGANLRRRLRRLGR